MGGMWNGAQLVGINTHRPVFEVGQGRANGCGSGFRFSGRVIFLSDDYSVDMIVCPMKE